MFIKITTGSWLPPKDKWEEELIFGRGSADQLAGVITQIIATKILLELIDLGSLKVEFSFFFFNYHFFIQ